MIPMLITTGMMVLRVITGMTIQVMMMMATVSEKIHTSLLEVVVVIGIPT